ncbi:MAG: fused MFS/spermidine synthase [Bacteroidota bacterium]|nr:fused MFS/spermidine synthase [Bacteroidota bacterium]
MKITKQTLLYFIVFFAGFSFLIYEVSWNRYLSLILGNTVTASTLVLAAFMGGFGLGAYFLGAKADVFIKTKRLLSIELAGIGIFSGLNFLIFDKGFQFFFGQFSNITTANITIFSVSFLLLLIPAFFMGGIIPAVTKLSSSNTANSDKTLAAVYSLETMGSALGGLFAGFILLGGIGQTATMWLAFFINILLAVILLFSGKFTILRENKTAKPGNVNQTDTFISKLIVFFTGFSVLALQIIWIRVFKTYFTNTGYTFALITAWVILGLSFGSYLYRRRAAERKNNAIRILRSLILLSLLALLGLAVLSNLPEILMAPFKQFSENAYFRLLGIPVSASLIISFPVATVSGYIFPLAYDMQADKSGHISKSIGKVLMVNTLGSVLGPLIAAFIFIPVLGVGKSVLAIAFLLFLVGGYVAVKIKDYQKIKPYRNILPGISALLLAGIIFSSPIQFVPPSVKLSDKKILSYNETTEGTIIVADRGGKGIFGKNTYVNNSSVIGSNYDAIKAVKMVGHIPFFAGLKAKKVLVIGFGIGVTTSAIASHPEVEQIDGVELVPGLVKSSSYYTDFNQNIRRDKRLNIIPGDGRHFLRLTDKTYDLISCDPTHPVLGSGNLYTQDYFQNVYDHLNPNGMTSEYLPLHKLRKKDLLGIIKTFHSVFPNSSVWLGQYHAILFGKKGKGKIDFSTWQSNIYAQPKDDFFYLDPYHTAACMVMDKELINKLPADIEINTDNLNYTEFFSFDCFDDSNLYNNLKYLSDNRCAVSQVFNNIPDEARMNQYVAGNKALTESLYYSLSGKKQPAVKALQKACLINPEDKEFPFLLKLYYGNR